MTQQLEILYNGRCPICSAEIAQYRRQAEHAHAPVLFIDLHDATLAYWGLNADQATRRFHARKDGQIISGFPAFRHFWPYGANCRACAGWRVCLNCLCCARWRISGITILPPRFCTGCTSAVKPARQDRRGGCSNKLLADQALFQPMSGVEKQLMRNIARR